MANNPLTNVSLQQLRRAVQIREQIDLLEQELNQVLMPSPDGVPAPDAGPAKRMMSAQARARIAAAQRARWAKVKGGNNEPKRGRSSPLKDRIIALLKSAGPKGVRLQEMCRQLRLTTNRLNTWFYSTGRKVKAIKRLDRGLYGWVE